MRFLLKDIYADKIAGEALVNGADDLDLDAGPARLRLTNGPLTRRYRVGERLKLRGIPRITADRPTWRISIP